MEKNLNNLNNPSNNITKILLSHQLKNVHNILIRKKMKTEIE